MEFVWADRSTTPRVHEINQRTGAIVKKTSTLLVSTILAAAVGFGCQPSAGTDPAANNTANKTAVNTAAKTPEAKPESTPAGSVGSLATPSEAYRTAHALRKNKDMVGLKKIMSADVIEFLTMIGEAEEPKKTLDEMIAEMFSKPQAEKAESRNEKIDGDRATLEYLTETGDWKTMDFEKVDGKWLMSLPKADDAEEKK